METSNPYFKQVKLLVEILPLIANHECFALKGGTAINLFVRDLPRLSVDVDLTYVPVVKREKALVEIDASLRTLKTNLTKSMGLKVTSRVLSGTKYLIKLLVQTESVHVRIETTPVMRGVVNGLVDMEISPKVQDVFGYVRVPVVSFNDLYSGKLCAALDRQHPRDLFDISVLLQNEGITKELLDTFLIYLVCGNRPISELLAPNLHNINSTNFHDFMGMVNHPISLEEIQETQIQMVKQVHDNLTEDQKRFLLLFKQGRPNWDLLASTEVDCLPAIQWKLHNLKKMSKQNHKAAMEKLEKVLYG